MKKLILSAVMSMIALIVFAEPQQYAPNVRSVTLQISANGTGSDAKSAKRAAITNVQIGMGQNISNYQPIVEDKYFELIGQEKPSGMPITMLPEFNIEKEEYSINGRGDYICTLSAKTVEDLKQILRTQLEYKCSSNNIPFNEAKFTQAYNYAVKKVNNIQ